MSMDHQRLVYLLTQYIENNIKSDDFDELIACVRDLDAAPDLLKAIEEIEHNIPAANVSLEDKARVYNSIINSPVFHSSQISIPRRISAVKSFKWLSIAAMFIICLAAGVFFFNLNQKNGNPKSPTNRVARKNTIDMGGNKAILILSNGSELTLSKNGSGTIALEGKSAIQQKEGVLSYEKTVNTDGPILYNTIKTPKGSTFQLLLADGTKVWLNTNSSLTYPTVFVGNTRTVTVNGEAYFEVFHDKNRPFLVNSNLAQIAVLGTHFNVKAYSDHKMVTTLISGSVKIVSKNANVIIKPDQEACVSEHKSQIEVHDVDAGDAIAWTKGYFLFQNENIKDVMETIAQWYDMDIEFRGDLKGKTFGGTIARFKDVDQLLKSIELTGAIHFKIEGRKVIVMP